MNPLKGKQLLEKVRLKIDDPSYNALDELEEAQEWIAIRAPYNWLRQTSTTAVAVISGATEFTMNLANVRRILTIYIGDPVTSDVGAVEGITLTSTDPVSINITGHGRSTGDSTTFVEVGGTTELNGNTYTITKTDADNFTLDSTSSDNFTAWTSGGRVNVTSANLVNWKQMEEFPPELFQEEVAKNAVISVSSDGSINWKYRLSGPGPFGKIIITPTPDSTKSIRVDYLKIPTDLALESYPDIPTAYQQQLINLASGFVLERSDNENKVALGTRFIQRAESYFRFLLNDLLTHNLKSLIGCLINKL